MSLTIHIPKEAEEVLRQAFGGALDEEAKEALAVEAFRRGKLSLGQFAELMGLSTYEADGLLKARGVTLSDSAEQFDRDMQTLNRHLNK